MEPTWSDPLPAPPQAPEPAAGPVVPADPPAPAAAPLAPDTRHAEDTGRVSPDDDGTPAVSFLRPDDHDSVWRRRSVRLVLAAVAALLCGLLLVQVMVQERNRIVLLEPATRPVVLALCQLAGCTIGPLRQIESVVIDSSSFGRLRGEGYRLGFSLRNQAPIDIAMPAIELSLTDTQDQALIRRVILPAEFGAPGDVLAAGADWSGALALNIRADATAERIAGYRLLAFYP